MTRQGVAPSEAAHHETAATAGTVVDSLSNGIYNWQLFRINPPEFPDGLHGGFAERGCWARRTQ
eukprot:450359-Alexandrium_andersonii.AAC.1